MAEDELDAFRKRWKQELTSKQEEQCCVSSPSCDFPARSGQKDFKNRYFEDPKQNVNKASSVSNPKEDAGGGKAAAESEDQPQYVSIARSLLDGRTSPLLDRIQEERTRRKRQYHDRNNVCSASLQQPQRKVKKNEELLDQLIQDLV